MAGTRDWDAGTYDRVSGPQLEWAGALIERLALTGSETVLDAGCGSGRVTELLLEALPDGRVIAVDGSEAMVEQARERLDLGRSELIHSDLLEIDLPGRADAVFSNAVFHWILDHERLFGRLHAALRRGGRFEAQCGGEGNVAAFYAAVARVAAAPPFAEHLAGYDPHRFASPAATERLLESAGFEDVRCWLEPRPVRPPEPREFIRTVCIGSHSDQLPERIREEFLDRVMDQLGSDPELDYVRLNISARKGAAPA
jgi:trans-aconitate 2-methyltransferase